MSTDEYLILASLDASPCDALPVWISLVQYQVAIYGAGVKVVEAVASTPGTLIHLDITGLSVSIPYWLNNTNAWGPYAHGAYTGGEPSYAFNRTSPERRSIQFRIHIPASFRPTFTALPLNTIGIRNAVWTGITQTSGTPTVNIIYQTGSEYFPGYSSISLGSHLQLKWPRVNQTWTYDLTWRGAWE